MDKGQEKQYDQAQLAIAYPNYRTSNPLQARTNSHHLKAYIHYQYYQNKLSDKSFILDEENWSKSIIFASNYDGYFNIIRFSR